MSLKIMQDSNSPVSTNTYLIWDEDTKDAWIIDASSETKPFIDKIEEEGLKIKYLMLTHGHWDHILSLDFWREKYGVKIVAHKNSKDYLEDARINMSFKYSDIPDISTYADIYLEGGEGVFDIFEYYYTPGHSYDHLMYKLGDKLIFSGDLIFRESIGRTDIYGANFEDLKSSILNIVYKKFDDETILLPGHGGSTTIKHEKQNNPWIREEE